MNIYLFNNYIVHHSYIDTEDEEEGDGRPPVTKKQKINREPVTLDKIENKLCFYVTKVRGIADKFNSKTMAIGICDILSPSMGDLQASAQVRVSRLF